jgi:hypothetical protein
MLHVHPAPAAATGMRPGGTLSIRVTTPVVGEAPGLLTVRV